MMTDDPIKPSPTRREDHHSHHVHVACNKYLEDLSPVIDSQLHSREFRVMSNNKSSDSPPLSSKEAEGAASASASHVQISDESNHDESNVEKEEVVTTTTMEDPPTISPMDPPSPSYSGLQLPPHPARNTDDDDDGGVSLEAWSEWDSIADNASKSSSSTRCATTKAALSSNNTTGVASSQGKSAETTRTIIYEDEGDLPSLSGRRNCEPPDANTTTTTHPQHQHRLRNVTPNDPPEYGYRKKVHHAAASTGIHNIQMNSRGHVYLDGEESVANSSNGPPVNLAKAINNHNHSHEDDNETTSTRYSINSNTSSTNSPPPPSDYFNQPSHRQIYPAEPRGGAVDIVSGNHDESSFVGISEATSIASNTTRSTTTTFHSGSRGGGGGSNGEYFDGNVNSALDRHLSKGGGSAGRTDNSNSNSRRMRDPQDFTETIKKQDPQVLNESDNATGGYGNNTYSGRQASRLANNFDAAERQEMEPFIGRQQQRVVYASSAKRDLHNHYRNAYPDKAKDSDLESGRASSHQQHTQRVRFADKMFSSRESAFSSTSSSHQVVVGNATSSSSSHSAYGLSWRDRSVCSDSSATSKSSIDSQSSNSSMSNRVRGSSNGSSRSGGVGREVVSLLANGLKNIFEGLHSTASAPSSNSSTFSNSSSSSGGGGARNYNSARFNYLKRYTALLATLSMMMLVTIGSYSGAFFGASANDNNDNNADSPRGLGIEHDMRPPVMGLMDNVPHQAMLKGSGGAGVNNNGGGNIIMGGGGGGGLPPLVKNGQVVDWDKVPPHLRGYYSKVFGVQGGGNANQQQQQQQQQQAEMQYTQQKQIQEEDPNAAAQAIQSIGNEAIGAENSFKVPTLEQHEFQQHIQELEGAVPFLGQQQQEQMQQEQQMQQQDEQKVKEELAKQQLEQVHQRQQAEAEQQRAQAEQKQRAQAEADQQQQQQQEALQRAQAEAEQQQQQQQQQQEQQPKEMSLPSPEEINAAREENAKRIAREEEMRRKQAEEEALRMAGNAEEKMKQQRDDSEAAAAQNGEANKMNEASTNAVDQVNSGAENGAPLPEPVVAAAAEVGGQNNAEDENANATLESLQSELSELMDMVKQRGSDKG